MGQQQCLQGANTMLVSTEPQSGQGQGGMGQP